MLGLVLISIVHLVSALEDVVHGSHVVEENLVAIKDQMSLEKKAVFFNVGKVDDALILRSSSGQGSLINLNQEITTDEWAVEFTIKNLLLKDVEKAGFYLWYLDKPLQKGDYKGGMSNFSGFVTGIEFSKDRADIAFVFNYGLDFNGKEDETTRLDHINPLLIDNLDEFRVKIIHTHKNFKVELYNIKGQLLADSFRIHEPLVMNQHVKEKAFAITTDYRYCPNDVFLELKDFKISSRSETENYDVGNVHTEYNQYPRNKSDDELRLAVANLDHFMNYLTIVLGTKDKNSIVEMTIAIKKKLRGLKDSIDGIFGSTSGQSQRKPHSQSVALDQKIKELESMGEELEIKVEMIAKKLRGGRGGRKRRVDEMLRWVLIGVVVIFAVSAMKSLGGRLFGKLSSIPGKDK